MSKGDGLRVLVTEGTSGLGQAIVQRLTDDGAAVVFSGRDPERGGAVAQGTRSVFVATDARDEGGVRRTAGKADSALGGIDALVCCAGVALDAPLSETSLEDWQDALDVNLTVPYLYSLACLPLLREAGGGSIVHVASDVGVWGDARIGAYSVSSAALITLAQMLAVEAGPHGITVNAVCPGAAGRSMATTTTEPGDEHGSDPEGRLVPPVGHLASPEEIAGVVAFLTGPDARLINGAALLVDGGMRAGYRAWSVKT
ncbi:MAG: SDR family NAD(P)-dependent oxidoreductase [Actinomycetota bacterium]